MELIDGHDYYGILNLDRECSTDDVKRAYKKYSQAFHPDRHRHDHMDNEARDAFSKINEAYSVLIDKNKRKLYDEEIEDIKRRNNRALVRYMITDYANVDFIQERKKLLDDIAVYSALITRGNSSVTINLSEMIHPRFEEASFIEKLLQTNIDNMVFHQSSEFELSQSNIIKFDSQMMLQNDEHGQGLFGIGINHILSPTSSGGIIYYIGNGSKLIINGTKLFNKKTKCNIVITGGLKEYNLLVGYQIKVAHQLMHNLKTTVICESFTPPELTFKVAYAGETFVYTEMFTKISKHIITYGTNLMYNITNNLIVGLSTSINNKTISGGYSAEYRVDTLNRVYGSVSLSHDEGVVLKLNYQRQNQTITFPIMLADSISLTAALVGTLGGIIFAGFFDLIIIQTLKLWDKQKYNQAIAKQEQDNLNKMKIEAKAAIELMKPRYDTIVENEHSKDGLIILKAIMGELTIVSSENYDPYLEIVDIKIPLQFLVRDSKLVVKAGSKYSIPGFYKINSNQPIFIQIVYSFKGAIHKFNCHVDDAIILPKKCHLVDNL